MRPGRNGGKLNTGGVNPGAGRPKKIPELTKLIDNVLGEDGGKSKMEEVVKALLNEAKKGNTQAAKVLLEYAYGKPKATVELTNPDGSNVFTSVEVVIKRPDEAKD